LDAIHRNHDGWMLSRPIRLLGVETAVDGAGLLGTVVVGFGGGHHYVIAHLRAEHLRLPAEHLGVKLCHARSVLEWHFKVHYGVHFVHRILLFSFFSARRGTSAASRRGYFLNLRLTPPPPQIAGSRIVLASVASHASLENRSLRSQFGNRC